MATPPEELHDADPEFCPAVPRLLGPKARGMPGRELFAAEINKMEQEKEKLARQREEEEEERRKEAARCAAKEGA